MTRYRGVEDSVRLIKEHVLSPRGALSPIVRLAAEDIVREIAPKDYLSELLAIRYWANVHIPYCRDPAHVEWMRDPEALLAEIKLHKIVRADCDEYAALIAALWLAVGNTVDIVTVGFQKPPPFGPKPNHTHVFVRGQIPKSNQWIVGDPVAGTREMQMLGKVQDYRFISLN